RKESSRSPALASPGSARMRLRSCCASARIDRRRREKRIGAGCDWRKGAGIDTSDRKMIPNFNKGAGFDCMVTVGGSAEERGYFLIDPAPDAKSLTLFLQSPIGAESDKLGKTEGDSLDLGPEDRTFALTRIDSKACEPFKATVK